MLSMFICSTLFNTVMWCTLRLNDLTTGCSVRPPAKAPSTRSTGTRLPGKVSTCMRKPHLLRVLPSAMAGRMN